jgi:hypothetical protein
MDRGSPEGTSGDPKTPVSRHRQEHRDTDSAPKSIDAVHHEASIRMPQKNGSGVNQ